MSQEKNPNSFIIWITDECITPNKSNWKTENNEEIFSVSELSLSGTEDAVISATLSTSFPKGFVIVTKNKHKDKKGDYFANLPNQGIVKFSSEIKTKEEQKKIFEKFRKMFKNFNKIIGATILLGKKNIIYKKGKKQKTVLYNHYI